ncbi:MAG: hypothetical protein ACPGU1_07115 [Myxococcota bacterium]
MKKSIAWWITCLAVLGLFALPAQAGIIITEGKIADEQEPTKEASATTGRRVVVAEKSASDAADDDEADGKVECAELDDDGFCVQVDSTVDDVSLKEVGDLNNDDPDGWDCTPIGAGLEVCEQPGGTGSSPGAGAGGGLGVDGSPTVGGCQGGGSGPGWLAMVLLFLVMVPRRHVMLARR